MARSSTLQISPLQEDLPVPVASRIRVWGILARFANMVRPSTSLAKAHHQRVGLAGGGL
ncbi:hypothetical protein IW256_002210 [Actinomadura viridis]|uniref:Uncharacterized protein n=1 Tax=Actinomadura viridis TaxID=58110 RepID=A0A931GIJ0_9ACTN|nr:hypothetical protein [Actinomadura viridis]